MAFDDSSSSESGAIAAINVTPLVDVMLVLLVIFMVTAPILQQGVTVSLPQVQAAPLPGEERQLVVTVDPRGQVFLNDAPIRVEELRGKLAAILRAQPQKQVYLRADQNVRYGEVMRVVAAVKAAGVERLGMVTEPPREEPQR
jgi:biopolymer transport protein TolR